MKNSTFAALSATKNKLLCTAFGVVGLAILPVTLSATAIPLGGGGVVDIANLAGTMVGVSNACIDWGYPSACQTTTGIQDSVSSADAAVFTSGSTPQDTIKDLPAGVLLPLVDFETIQSPLPGGVVFFDLTAINIPAVPAGNNCTTFALNAICTPGGGSPFTLIQTSATQVSINFSVLMSAYTGTSASGTTPYQGIFTTQLSGSLPNGLPDTIPNILNFIAGGGVITSTWSASESPLGTVPEPYSFALVGVGLIGLSFLRRRRA